MSGLWYVLYVTMALIGLDVVQLAHPLYGIMMLDFRPVDCFTKQPLAFLPGFINSTVYGDRVETGWAWFPYRQTATAFWAGVRPQG